tara:strand:+ start:373 stop:492 length:120 start_codon:yes stop_codon:yes gene_type:complete
MELILICSLFINVCFAVPDLKKRYLEYKKKKDILLYKDE